VSVHAPILQQRRSFLRGGRDAPSRAPWAIAEADFVDRCTRCDACIEACPQAVLLRGDGGFPELRFDAGECTFCAACLDACAPQALHRDQARPWRWRAVREAGCLAEAGVVCRSCAEVCPQQAIGFDRLLANAAPSVDASACNGCGACASVCPSAALTMQQAVEA
jgi:ferredoxin-type protein NapF